MSHLEQLVEQHVRAYEARLKRIDELLDRARRLGEDLSAAGTGGETPDPRLAEELARLERERERLAALVASYRRRAREGTEREVLEHLGPMIVWEEVAQRLEALVERLEGGKAAGGAAP